MFENQAQGGEAAAHSGSGAAACLRQLISPEAAYNVIAPPVQHAYGSGCLSPAAAGWAMLYVLHIPFPPFLTVRQSIALLMTCSNRVAWP